MAGSVDVLLDKIDEGVTKVRAHYEADLAAQEVSDELLYDVRQVIVDCHSALGWTATNVKQKYFPGGTWDPYFPLWDGQERFQKGIDRQIRGLRAAHPTVASAFERHQPFQPGKAELGYLPALNRVNDHRDFTPQERIEQHRVKAETAGGGSVDWDPSAVTFGAGVSILGAPVDPRTQRPVPHPSVTVTDVTYVDWLFVDPRVSVLATLEALARLVRDAVEDIDREASL